jgi:HSP20 family protein
MNEFSRLQQQMARVMDHFSPGERGPRAMGVFPAVNVHEDSDNFYLTAEIPGVEQKDLEITAVYDSVTIKGERKIDDAQDVNYHRRERGGGKFSRVVTLNDRIDPEQVEASLKNGVLTVKMAKAEESKPKQISITANT